jgi:hypothetical protein
MKKLSVFLILTSVVCGIVAICGCTGGEGTDYSSGGSTEATATETCPVQILEHHLVKDEFGVYVEGVAQNVGNKRLKYVEIKARFYDADGVLIDEFLDNHVDVDPGQKFKFKIYGPMGDEAKNVAKYDIAVGTWWTE